MKTIAQSKKRNLPVIKIDKSLNKYDDIVLFPEKLAKANKAIKKLGLPVEDTSKAKSKKKY